MTYILDSPTILPSDPEPVITKEVENITVPNNSANLDDLLLYTITLTNPTPGSLWKNVYMFDYLPPELVVDLDSMTLIRPNGSKEKVGYEVYRAVERSIIVPVAQIRGGETYTFTYRAKVATDDGSTQQVPYIVNTVTVEGENPDGTPINPTTEARILFTPGYHIPLTGDDGNIFLWVIALLASAFGMLSVFVWRKQRQIKGAE